MSVINKLAAFVWFFVFLLPNLIQDIFVQAKNNDLHNLISLGFTWRYLDFFYQIFSWSFPIEFFWKILEVLIVFCPFLNWRLLIQKCGWAGVEHYVQTHITEPPCLIFNLSFLLLNQFLCLWSKLNENKVFLITSNFYLILLVTFMRKYSRKSCQVWKIYRKKITDHFYDPIQMSNKISFTFKTNLTSIRNVIAKQ